MRMITTPTQLEAAGTVPKSIFEYVARMSGKNSISVARMVSPKGWSEPGQTPEFEEISLVLSGSLLVETRDGVVTLRAGQACLPVRENGFATALLPNRQSMSRSAHPPSSRKLCTGTEISTLPRTVGLIGIALPQAHHIIRCRPHTLARIKAGHRFVGDIVHLARPKAVEGRAHRRAIGAKHTDLYVIT